MRPRLREVATVSGVSEATVSRVLNGRRGVAEQTRQRVLHALGELGYDESVRPRLRHSRTIGVIVPELDNPIFPSLAQAIDARLARHGYTAVLASATTETGQESDIIEMLLDRGMAGVVIVSGRSADVTGDQRPYAALVATTTPLVFVNSEPSVPGVPTFSCDDQAAAEMAVVHLTSLGHERIGLLVGPARYMPSARKIAGFRAAMTATVGAVDDALIIESVFTVEGGQAGMAPLLEHGVTGVVTGSDLMALGAIRAARRWGLDVPRDVSVVGYDGTFISAFTDPSLTTLRQPIGPMGAAAADAIVAALDGDSRPHGAYHFAPELVVRESTGPAPRRGAAAAGR